MWTCDVWTKLTDLTIFNSPSGIFFASISRTSADLPLEDIPKVTFESAFSDQSDFEQKYGYLHELMDTLEPLRLRAHLYRGETPSMTISLYTYAHSIVRWKEAILYVAPEMGRIIAFFEILFRSCFLHMCKLCDHTFKSAQKDLALILNTLILDEAQYLRESGILEPLVAESIIPALESRLKVLCAQISDIDLPEKPMRKLELQNLALTLYDRTTTSSFLPPHYCSPQGTPYTDWAVREEWSPPGTTVQWDAPPCLLSRDNSDKSSYDTVQTDQCCYNCGCGWMFDSLPSGVLSFFDQCTLSFAQFFHAIESDIMPALFGPADIEEMKSQKELAIVKLRKKRVIFRQALNKSVFSSFLVLHELKQRSTTMKLSEDQLGVIAGIYRPAVLFLVIETAVLKYTAFIECDGKIAGAENVQQLIAHFIDWEMTAPEVQQLDEDLCDDLFMLDFSRLNPVVEMSCND